MTEKEKMILGLPFIGMDKELISNRNRAKSQTYQFNNFSPEEGKQKQQLLKELLGAIGKGSYIESPLRCDYGYNIHLAKQVFINYDCVMLDAAPIYIGEKVLIGPRVQILTTTHPVETEERLIGISIGKSIRIGKGAWIGAGVILLPGIEIGEYSIIGAGSVVTKSIGANVTAVGNPCKVIAVNKD